jgi:hypothetical protein
MGLIGLALFAVGVSGHFRPVSIAVLLIGAAAIAGRGMADTIHDCREGLNIIRQDWAKDRIWLYLVLGLVGAIALLALIVALAPPWAYDGLIYHLQA